MVENPPAWADGSKPAPHIYIVGGDDFIRAEKIGEVEGWPELMFADGSTAVVRPSRVIENHDAMLSAREQGGG